MFNEREFVFGDIHIHIIELSDFYEDKYLHLLNEHETKRLADFILPKRKKEFVATRFLKEQLFPGTQIQYNELGAPFLDNSTHISISHSPNHVGIAHCKTHKIGFDLEQIRDKVHRIKHKFLHQEEYQKVDTEDTETLIKIWSGKEALFKLAGLENVTFATDLIVLPIESEHWQGQIIRDGICYFLKMAIFTQDDYVISINLSDVQETF
jgi:phosphopantetheinyl transferase